MTVQELINELSKIEDKTKVVYKNYYEEGEDTGIDRYEDIYSVIQGMVYPYGYYRNGIEAVYV